MVTFFWIVVGSIVVSTPIALVPCKRSKLTLFENAENWKDRRGSRMRKLSINPESSVKHPVTQSMWTPPPSQDHFVSR